MANSPIKRIRTSLENWHIPAPLRKPIYWGQVIFADTLRSDLLSQASAMAYVTLLSLIPSLVAIFSIFSLFSLLFLGDIDPIQEIKSLILSNLAPGSGKTAVSYLEQMLDKLDLKTIGWSSFASVLVTLILLLRKIEIAINQIWYIQKLRNPLVRFIYFWTFMTLGMLGVAAVVGLSVPHQIQKVINPNDMGLPASETHSFLEMSITFSTSTLFFFLLYKIIPNCKVTAKAAAIGALVAAVLINQGGYLYGIFVSDSANYKTLYGALAQLPIFLMWLYVAWSIILLGALISWRVQEGFPSLTATSTLESAKNPQHHYRNLGIRNSLPVLALMAISRHFLEGTGRGLSSQQFAHHFGVPTSWAFEAFVLLNTKEFIHATKSGKELVDQFEPADPCVPAFPPDKTLVKDIVASLESGLDQWFLDHRDKITQPVQTILLNLGLGEGALSPTLTLRDAAASLPTLKMAD